MTHLCLPFSLPPWWGCWPSWMILHEMKRFDNNRAGKILAELAPAVPLGKIFHHRGTRLHYTYFCIYCNPYLWIAKYAGPELCDILCCYTWELKLEELKDTAGAQKPLASAWRRVFRNGTMETTRWEAAGVTASWKEIERTYNASHS